MKLFLESSCLKRRSDLPGSLAAWDPAAVRWILPWALFTLEKPAAVVRVVLGLAGGLRCYSVRSDKNGYDLVRRT